MSATYVFAPTLRSAHLWLASQGLRPTSPGVFIATAGMAIHYGLVFRPDDRVVALSDDMAGKARPFAAKTGHRVERVET